MKYFYVYLIATVIFLGLDAIWLGLVARGFYQTHLGALMLDKPRFGVAAVFYAVYVVGLVYFAIAPGLGAGSFGLTVLRAALFGFFCYLTYDATNLATLKGYDERIVLLDVAWGTILTAIAGGGAFLVARAFSLWQA